MASIFANAVRHHHAALKRAAGVPARYMRGSTVVFLVLVPRGRDNSGVKIEDVAAINTDSEWLILASDLVLDGVLMKPEKGDTIAVNTREGETEFYVVLPPMDGERCWRASDKFGDSLLVFAKYRRTELNA